jgi:hypothetical protein
MGVILMIVKTLGHFEITTPLEKCSKDEGYRIKDRIAGGAAAIAWRRSGAKQLRWRFHFQIGGIR